ncbi:MAG: InlB B-repeat-containing protein [Lachnospiraceae bacterium]|nr:InlB B-repeat-containing protein [Lachnospiraceae bacterium]
MYHYRIKTRNYIDGEIGYTGTSASVCNKVYQVIYDANGGDGVMDSTWVPYGYKTKLLPNAFVRKGYRFAGWHSYRVSDDKWRTEENGWQTESAVSENGYTKIIYKDQAGVAKTTSVNNDTVIMYAVWEKLFSPGIW